MLFNSYNSRPNAWVLPKPGLSNAELSETLASADMVVSDLDDTLADSPAKRIALGSRSKFTSPRYHIWLAYALGVFLLKGKNAETRAWQTFVRHFLKTPEDVARQAGMDLADLAAATIYPGVEEFYSLMPISVHKAMVTRNILEIAQACAGRAGIDTVLAGQSDKVSAMETIVSRNPDRQRYLVIGDSCEDWAMVKFLRELKRDRAVEDVFSIYVAKTPLSINPEFDVNIGRNYEGLADIMRNAETQLAPTLA